MGPSPKPVLSPSPAPAPTPKLGHYCGNKQEGDGCGIDHRSNGWCSESTENCDQCNGQWCAHDSATAATAPSPTVPSPKPRPAPTPKLGYYCGNKQEADGCGID